MTTDAGSRIYVIPPDGSSALILRASRYDREADFQKLLARYPALLDGEQFDPVSPRRWLLVGQEIPVPDSESNRWSLDHLFVDQDGVARLVEVKRKSDTRLRREVVAQMLDYAANGSLRWTAPILQAHFERSCAMSQLDADQVPGDFVGDDERAASFWSGLESNLRAGRMRLVFVADEIPEELLRVIEFLNSHMSPTEVLALELRYFEGEGFSTHIPRLLGRTVSAVAQKEAAAARRTWSRESFLEDARAHLPGAGVLALERFLDRCTGEFELSWGTGSQRGSFTPRLSEVSARGPITVFSDGMLHVKPSWLRDTPEAESWREAVTPRLARLGWKQGDDGNTLKIQAAEWLPYESALFAAISEPP